MVWRVKFQNLIGRSAANAADDMVASTKNVTISLFMGTAVSFRGKPIAEPPSAEGVELSCFDWPKWAAAQASILHCQRAWVTLQPSSGRPRGGRPKCKRMCFRWQFR